MKSFHVTASRQHVASPGAELPEQVPREKREGQAKFLRPECDGRGERNTQLTRYRAGGKTLAGLKDAGRCPGMWAKGIAAGKRGKGLRKNKQE